MQIERKRLDTLEVLRCFAFLGVFGSHTGVRIFKGTGHWGVSVFFILTGFLLVYNYYSSERIRDVSLKSNFKFMITKMEKLFLLHIITTLLMVVFMFAGNEKETLSEILVNLVANVFLIQTWFPILGSINAVSWYLVTYVLIYFLFPFVLKNMEKRYNSQKAVVMLTVSFLVQIFSRIIVEQLLNIGVISAISGGGYHVEN